MKKVGLLICFFIVNTGWAQFREYSVQNAHSHNDYEQTRPFELAYEYGFGSVEADVFLTNGDLLVAHDIRDTQSLKNLKSLYLRPLLMHIRKNKGRVYANRHKRLLLLIDCKTEAVPTLKRIIAQLQEYPQIVKCKSVQIVITGNQPNKDSLFAYPSFIWFDGNLNYNYSEKNRSRIALFSANFRNYSQWNGVGEQSPESIKNIKAAVEKAHKAAAPIRFWGAPDNPNAWSFFQSIGADYINTDDIPGLARFLK
ncbi:MAG: phosphatidylinositol-specific phospholipase C/glycerophosphodiester phosphodiesterase family protein [Niabella sp.]